MDTFDVRTGMLPHCDRFNGAMTFQPWIRARQQLANRDHPGFNGAMTFQPWIRIRKLCPEHVGYDVSMGP